MKDDIRYTEFLFHSALARRDQKFEYININSPEQQKLLGLDQSTYEQMIIALAEDSYVVFDDQSLQHLVGRLRGEISANYPRSRIIYDHDWGNPREAIRSKLMNGQGYGLRVTFRGRCRIEELRELLRRDRILEPFGVMLDMRYFLRDFDEALHRPADVPVSVLRLDMDSFKAINDNFGHAAGDVVMKSYLEAVRDSISSFNSCYRGRGDEVAVLMVGQEHKRATEFAEKIRLCIETMQCKFKDLALPKVTASIGVATTPPEARTKDMEILADQRQNQAKKEGKNRVVSS